MSSTFPEGAPIYGPFFGVMGAASAIIFSGKFYNDGLPSDINRSPSRDKIIDSYGIKEQPGIT